MTSGRRVERCECLAAVMMIFDFGEKACDDLEVRSKTITSRMAEGLARWRKIDVAVWGAGRQR
jgi:NADP-dependent 3-hydroxy acid dehydrogenase YdfG